MKVLSLKVNETYVTRNGNQVRITSAAQIGLTHWNPFHRFNGSNGEIYRTDGRAGILFQKDTDIVDVSPTKIQPSSEERYDRLFNRVVSLD